MPPPTRSAFVGLPQVIDGTGRVSGGYREFGSGLDGLVGLDRVGDHLKCAAGQTASKDKALIAKSGRSNRKSQDKGIQNDNGAFYTWFHEASSFTVCQ
jgi:hypothetical protein